MKHYDILALPGRKYDPKTTIPGMYPCLVDGQAFYKTKPNTGGGRDLTTLGDDEAKLVYLVDSVLGLVFQKEEC